MDCCPPRMEKNPQWHDLHLPKGLTLSIQLPSVIEHVLLENPSIDDFPHSNLHLVRGL
jgi:hypothetical protein